ncbi:MAG TPA: hypothetical protein VEH53_09700 [archaeon]|nr:hypothetical protein [archaeon]
MTLTLHWITSRSQHIRRVSKYLPTPLLAPSACAANVARGVGANVTYPTSGKKTSTRERVSR